MESSTKVAFGRAVGPLLKAITPKVMPALRQGIMGGRSKLAPVIKDTFRAMSGAAPGSAAPLTRTQMARGILFPKLKGIGPAGDALSGLRKASLLYTAGSTGQQAWDISGQAVDAVHGLADLAQLNGMSQDQVNQLRSMNRLGLLKTFLGGSPLGQNRENPIIPGAMMNNRRVYDLGMTVLRDRMRASASSLPKLHEALSPVSGLLSRGIRYGLGEKSPVPMKEVWGELARASGTDKAIGNFVQSMVGPYVPTATASSIGATATQAVSDPSLRGRLRGLGTRVGMYGHTDTNL